MTQGDTVEIEGIKRIARKALKTRAGPQLFEWNKNAAQGASGRQIGHLLHRANAALKVTLETRSDVVSQRSGTLPRDE